MLAVSGGEYNGSTGIVSGFRRSAFGSRLLVPAADGRVAATWPPVPGVYFTFALPLICASGPLGLRSYLLVDSILLNLLFDAVVLIAVVVIMFRRMSFWHPLAGYLLFHVFSYTMRGWDLYAGATPMYGNTANFEVVTEAEISRALLWADVALIFFVFGCLWAHARFGRTAQRPVQRRVLNPRIIAAVCTVCLPAGLYVFLSIKSGGIAIGEDSAATNYLSVVAMWPIGCLTALIFTYGFRPQWLILVALYLSFVALQGYHRFMLVLPLLFFAAYYLQARRRRWPTLTILIGAVLVALLFPRLKMIGAAFQQGETAEVVTQLKDSFDRNKKFEEGENFLDQFAAGLTMTDFAEKKFLGSTYLAIITLPVPRAWWANKPGLADHLVDISTSTRQYNVEGRILTYVGEAYLNYGYAGIFIVPLLLGFGLTTFCLRATTGPMDRLSRYLYLIFFMILVQVFRDGMLSLFVFTIVHNLPMLFIWILHSIPGLAPKVWDLPPADPMALEHGNITPPFAPQLPGPPRR